jgi:enoyl-CoA hydratase
MMRKFNTITVSIDEEIAVITINRPKFLNALNTDVLRELSEAVNLIN